MLRVRIEMCPRGDESPDSVREIGRMYIANTGGDRERGDYTVAVCRRRDGHPCDEPKPLTVPRPVDPTGPKPTRSGHVSNYPRLSYNIWRLIARSVLACFPEERRIASTPGDDPRGNVFDPCEPSDEEALELGLELCEGVASCRHGHSTIDIGHRAWLRGARPRGF